MNPSSCTVDEKLEDLQHRRWPGIKFADAVEAVELHTGAEPHFDRFPTWSIADFLPAMMIRQERQLAWMELCAVPHLLLGAWQKLACLEIENQTTLKR